MPSQEQRVELNEIRKHLVRIDILLDEILKLKKELDAKVNQVRTFPGETSSVSIAVIRQRLSALIDGFYKLEDHALNAVLILEAL